MSKLLIIVSPLTKPEQVKTQLEEIVNGREVIISDDPLADADIVIAQYSNELSRNLTNGMLDQVLETKELIVQKHNQLEVGARIGEITSDDTISTSEVSKISAGAFASISFANTIAKLNENFVIETPLEYDFKADPVVTGWLDRAIVQNVEEVHPATQVEDETETEETLEPEPAPEPETVEVEPTIPETNSNETTEVDSPVTDVQEVQLEIPTPAEVVDLDDYQPEVELKQVEPEPAPVSNEVKTETPLVSDAGLDNFDPIADAFNNSVKMSEEIENSKPLDEPETKVEEEKAVKPKVGILPNYPKVKTTVEIIQHPLTKLADDASVDNNKLFGWAGSADVLTDEIELIEQRVEEANARKRALDLSDEEINILGCMSDRVGSQTALEMQFVEGAKWSQALSSETKRIPIITVVKNPNYGDNRYVGKDAVALIANRMRIGVTIGVLLPHTGIYCLIVSPGDDEVLNTLSIINSQRIEALRSSSGILLGNSNYYLNKQVMDLFLNSITDCSLASYNREILQGLIDGRDIDIIADALAASIYPDGYNYNQTCGLELEDRPGEVCNSNQEFLVDLKRMVFIDNSRLNEYQRNLALGGLTKRSLKEIEEYKSQSYLGLQQSYEITEGIEFVYEAPTAQKSIEAGEAWIGEISKVVDHLLAFRQDENERNVMINQRMDISRIREFSHWVKDIQVDGLSLNDPAKVTALLNKLSRNPDVVAKVGKTLAEFQRKSLIAMVAIPRVPCPSCQKTDMTKSEVSQYLIPQDAVSRFFTLAHQRL